MDETSLYMDIPASRTVDKKEKNIEIFTFGAEKVSISLILTIAGNGHKIPSILIFKAKKKGSLEIELNKLKIIQEKKIFVYCQENMV